VSVIDIVTPTWLKTRYLYGIDLTDDEGIEFPDDLFSHSIDSAASILESDLDIVLTGNRQYVERRDTVDFHTESFFLMHMDHRPMQSVDAITVQFGDYPSATLPVSWAQVDNHKAGQVQILPGPEGIGSIIFGGTVPFLGLSGLYGRPYTPLWFKFTYTAGFESELEGTVDVTVGGTTVTGTDTYFKKPFNSPAYKGGQYKGGFYTTVLPGHYVEINDEVKRVVKVKSDTVFEVDSAFAATSTGNTVELYAYPPAILDAVGLLGAMLPLDTAGDLIVGAGIASKSFSVDGLSTSINTTASSTNAGYGARMLSYKNRLKDLLKSIRRDYRLPNMAIL